MPVELTKVDLHDTIKQLKTDGFLTLLSHIDALPANLPPASTMEKKYADRHSDVAQREGFLARRRIARAILSLALDVPAERIEIGSRESGQPLVMTPSNAFHLSFAARGKLALIAIASRPIGVDLEIVETDMLIPWNMLRRDERALLDAVPSNDRAAVFSTLWTAKEAVVKALGLGFRIPPEAIQIEGWVSGEKIAVANLDELSAVVGPPLRQLHLKTNRNLVVAELTGGLVVGAASIA
ncbi:MAG: 4'-phosphopantetheinyl transferase family protein [Rhabdaerophilum sp.]